MPTIRVSSLLAITAIAIGVQPWPAIAQNTAAQELVRQAVNAMGGVEALRGLHSIAIKGSSESWEPNQSYTAGGEPKFLGQSSFARCRPGCGWNSVWRDLR
jgi:hypothetical protein